MVRQITSATLDVTAPGDADPFMTVPNTALAGASVASRIKDQKDTAKFTIEPDAANVDEYVGAIQSGDRLDFYVRHPENIGGDDGRAYGSGPYGAGYYGGTPARWTGVVRNFTVSESYPGGWSLQVDSEDLPFAVAGWRKVYDAFENRPIAHDPNLDPDPADRGIVNEILAENAPELSDADIDPIDTRTDVFANGRTLLDILVDLQGQGDAIMASRGDRLVFRPVGNIDPTLTLTPTDVHTADCRVTDDALTNDVRVNGGTDHAVDDAQEDTSGRQTVTETSRLMTRVDTRKSEIARVELYTDADRSGDADGLVVRLQKDAGDGSGPVEPDNRDSDVVKPKQLSAEFLSSGDWTTFILAGHTLPEPRPWLIVESDGETGQDVATDGAGGLAYRVHYPYPVNVNVTDRASQSDFRRRQTSIDDDSLNTFRAARREGESRLRHSRLPTREFQFDAQTLRTHRLQAGDVVSAAFPRLTVTGDYILTERNDEYDGVKLKTTFSAQEVRSL